MATKKNPKKSATTGKTAKRKATAVKTKAKRAASPVKKKPAAKQPKKASSKTSADARRRQESLALAKAVVEGILEKKGDNIITLDLRPIENAVCDYFIICEGNSNIQVEAIAESVEDTVKKMLGQRPYRSEGWENALWILIDYINVVVHVFQRETRQFYNLESLWADAEEVKFDAGRRMA